MFNKGKINRRAVLAGMAAVPAPALVASPALADPTPELLETIMGSILPLTEFHVSVSMEPLKALCEEHGIEWAEAWWRRSDVCAEG